MSDGIGTLTHRQPYDVIEPRVTATRVPVEEEPAAEPDDGWLVSGASTSAAGVISALFRNQPLDSHHLPAELQRAQELRKLGVSADARAALDQIRKGEMDMHLRMAQQQQPRGALKIRG